MCKSLILEAFNSIQEEEAERGGGLLSLWVLTFLNVLHKETMIIFECTLGLKKDWSKSEELAWGLQLPWGLGGSISYSCNPPLSSLAMHHWLSLLAKETWVHSQEELEEDGCRYLDPPELHFPSISIDPLQLWLPNPMWPVWATAEALETPFVLTASLTALLLSKLLFPGEYLFQIIVPQMFGVLFLQSESHLMWLFPAYIPDLSLLLYCFSIFNRTFNTFHFCILQAFCLISHIHFSGFSKHSHLGIRSPRFISWDASMKL